MLRFSILCLLILFVITPLAETQEVVDNFDLPMLAGKWQGSGEITLPMTEIALDIDGDAEFIYDSAAAVMRTYLNGSKMMFTYSDSGRLVHNPKTDSVSWEVWNNLGRYSRYTGRLEGNKITGVYPYRNNVYRVVIEIINLDSLTFNLSLTDDNGERTDKANLFLWRIE